MTTTRLTFCSVLLASFASALTASACNDSDEPSDMPATDGGEAGSGGTSAAGKPSSPGGGSTSSSAGAGGDPARGEAGGVGAEAGSGGTAEGGAGGEASAEGRLVIADPEATTLYVYAVPSLEQLAVFQDVTFADHPGFLSLNDGRVLFTDSGTDDLISLDVASSPPRIVGRAHLAFPAVHLAVDPSHSYAAVSGAASAAEDLDAFTLVRLSDFFHKSVPIPTGEPGVLLGGNPLYLYHRNDDPAQVEAYLFEDLWKGNVSLQGSVAIGAAPHGEALVHTSGKIFVAADDGINVVPTHLQHFGTVTQIPYDIDGKTGGRAYYARLSFDGKYLYSYLRDSGPDFSWPWKDWVSDAYIVDVENETAKRIEVGKGLVYRLADSEKFALFVQYHPDGDYACLLDTDPSSSTFQEMVGKVPLEKMSKTPSGPDADPWSSEAFRLAGMVPSGRWGFVTHGGDGKVSVIDTSTKEVSGQIELPTPLNYGGYLIGVEPGAIVRDTVGR